MIIREKALIRAALDVVFEVISNPARQPDWMPGLVSVGEVTGAGSETTYRWVFSAGRVKIEGTTMYTLYELNRALQARTTGGAAAEWDWLFFDRGGATEVQLALNINPPGLRLLPPIVKRLLERRKDRVVARAIENIRDAVAAG